MSQEQAQYAPPQPTQEHTKLQELAGTWNVDCEFYMDPSQPPMKVQGKETVEAFGQFWIQSVFECEMFGAPFRGRSTLGYDPESKQYISTWIDTMSPMFFLLKGKYDASGKVLETRGRGYDCMMHRETDYRTRDETKSKDEHVFEMFMTLPDGSETKMFTHRYRRASKR